MLSLQLSLYGRPSERDPRQVRYPAAKRGARRRGQTDVPKRTTKPTRNELVPLHNVYIRTRRVVTSTTQSPYTAVQGTNIDSSCRWFWVFQDGTIETGFPSSSLVEIPLTTASNWAFIETQVYLTCYFGTFFGSFFLLLPYTMKKNCQPHHDARAFEFAFEKLSV